jgi:hypothetical protein
MAGNVVRLRQDFSGQYRSEGPQFVGSIINTEGGPFYLTSDSMSFNNNGSIPLTDTGCESTCRTSVEGAGLSLNCSTYTLPFNLNPSYSSDGTYNVADDPAVINGTFVFESRFTWTLATTGASKSTFLPLLYCHRWVEFLDDRVDASIVRFHVICYKEANPSANTVFAEDLQQNLCHILAAMYSLQPSKR